MYRKYVLDNEDCPVFEPVLIYLFMYFFWGGGKDAFLLRCVHLSPGNLKPVFVSLCAQEISRLLKESVHPECREGSPLAYTGSM